MSERKRPVFGIISLALMLALVVAAIVVSLYRDPLPPAGRDESLAVAVGVVGEILATFLAAGAISLSATLLALVSFIRRERRGPAAVALCLSLSCLIVLIVSIPKL